MSVTFTASNYAIVSGPAPIRFEPTPQQDISLADSAQSPSFVSSQRPAECMGKLTCQESDGAIVLRASGRNRAAAPHLAPSAPERCGISRLAWPGEWSLPTGPGPLAFSGAQCPGQRSSP